MWVSREGIREPAVTEAPLIHDTDLQTSELRGLLKVATGAPPNLKGEETEAEKGRQLNTGLSVTITQVFAYSFIHAVFILY